MCCFASWPCEVRGCIYVIMLSLCDNHRERKVLRAGVWKLKAMGRRHRDETFYCTLKKKWEKGASSTHSIQLLLRLFLHCYRGVGAHLGRLGGEGGVTARTERQFITGSHWDKQSAVTPTNNLQLPCNMSWNEEEANDREIMQTTHREAWIEPVTFLLGQTCALNAAKLHFVHGKWSYAFVLRNATM